MPTVNTPSSVYFILNNSNANYIYIFMGAGWGAETDLIYNNNWRVNSIIMK